MDDVKEILPSLISQSDVSCPWIGSGCSSTNETAQITLFRNGQGVRSIPFLGFPIKVYVASFYTATRRPLRSVDDIMNSHDPMQFDFTFLRSVNLNRVSEAWQMQLDASVSYDYDTLPNDKRAFIKMLGPIAVGGTETVIMIDDQTYIIDQGIPKGSIPGRNFQRAFLSVWFGDRPVTDDLKQGLLGLSGSN